MLELTVDDEGTELEPPTPFLRSRTDYEMRGQSHFLEVEDVEQVLEHLVRRRGEDEKSVLERLRRWLTD